MPYLGFRHGISFGDSEVLADTFQKPRAR